MKRSSGFFARVALGVGLLVVLATAAPGQAASPAGNNLLQSELKQQQLQVNTQKAFEQLGHIIGEFERNGLGGEDVAVLRGIQTVLGKLSDSDMTRIIALLRQARAAIDPGASRRSTLEAFSGQKNVIFQLRRLLEEYERQRALFDLSMRFARLANKQSAGLRDAVSLVAEVQGRNKLNETQQIVLEGQQIEQKSINDETGLNLAILAELAKAPAGEAADRPQNALKLANDGGLNAALEAALKDLERSRLMSAAGSQKRARDLLREVSRLLAPPKDALAALRQALLELDTAIGQQKQLLEQTQELGKKHQDAAGLEDKQAELVEKTDQISEEVQHTAAAASAELKNATDKMQEARAVLAERGREAGRKREPALGKEREALASLEQARQQLLEQLAREEQAAGQAVDPIAQVQKLLEQVRELSVQQTELKGATIVAAKKPKELAAAASRQGVLNNRTREVQSLAVAPAPAAAPPLGDAATQMAKAEKILAARQSASEQQQAALDALALAEQELLKELNRLELAQQELDFLTKALAKLVEIIKQQQTIQLDTARAALNARAPALVELSGNQSKLGLETSQLQQDVAAPVPVAGSHLGEAGHEMVSAKSKLEQADAKSAAPVQIRALMELYLAKDALEGRIAELKQMLGQPTTDAKALADAAQILDQAQENVTEALDDLQQTPASLLDQLQQQQEEIASKLGPLARSSPSPTTGQAHQAASQAAQQLGQGNLPSAIGAMQQAQTAMQQAMNSGQAGSAGEAAQPAQAGQQRPSGEPGQGSPSLPELSRQQAEVQQLAEHLLAAQQAAPVEAVLADATQALGAAAGLVGPLAAGSALPGGARMAVQSAQGDLANATAQSAAGNAAGAMAGAQQAQAALAQAQAALALAQSGLSARMAAAGQTQSQGQGQGQGQGQSQGQGQGQGIGRGLPGPQGAGKLGNWAGAGSDKGPRHEVRGGGQFVGLPQRDRMAIQQSQAEKYPQEYGPAVEQYLKNLSDQLGEK